MMPVGYHMKNSSEEELQGACPKSYLDHSVKHLIANKKLITELHNQTTRARIKILYF